jgi:hypothetical protein
MIALWRILRVRSHDRFEAHCPETQKKAAAEPSSSSLLTDLLRRQLNKHEYLPNTLTRKLLLFC